jgi:hypothetical protein
MAQRKWPGPGSCCLARAINPFMGSPDARLLIYQNEASSKPAQGRDIHSVIDEDRSSRRERNGTAAGKRVRKMPIESNMLKQPP